MKRPDLALLLMVFTATPKVSVAEPREALQNVAAGASQRAAGPCWSPPPAQTVEEAVIAAQNASNVAAGPRPAAGAILALSDGRLKTAYSAGLLVGWGETGKRPDFAAVTAVGMSALLAPFAFIGRDGDASIADIFACDAASIDEMTAHAVSYLDPGVLERIAHRHRAGARLFVALPGSAARAETVWDLGAIAASGRPEARQMIGAILRASVDMTTFVDPRAMPMKVGVTAARNPALRRLGAGEAFLLVPTLGTPRTPIYLVHNGVLFLDESVEYAAQQAVRPAAAGKDTLLLTAQDIFSAAQQAHTPALIASPRAHMNIQTQQSAFDLSYMRALFLDTYRRGRMSREWRETIPDPRSQ